MIQGKQAGKTSNSTMAAAATVSKNAVPSIMRYPQKQSTMASMVPGFLQAKLAINKPGDRFEQEANATADRVIKQKSMAPQSLAAGAPVQKVVRQQIQCLQDVHSGQQQAAELTFKQLSHGSEGGFPLSPLVNAKMSSAVGADFSKVRIHTDQKAISMSRRLNAHAFTYGNDIYFNAGMYNPDTASGQHLLAHELTHVVQQGFAPVTQTGVVASSAPAGIQRLELDDLKALNPLEVNIEELVKRYMPELIMIRNAGGILPWIEARVTAAVERMVDGAMAPIKGAVDFVGSLSPAMVKIVGWIKAAGTKVARNDCSSLSELADMLVQLADELAAPAIEKIKMLSQKISYWFNVLWGTFGAPVWDFIKQYLGQQYELIKSLGAKLWDKTEPIRSWASTVWIKFKNWLGIGEGPEGQDGVIQWIETKVLAVWNNLKAKIEPFKKQLLIAGGLIIMLSPAGPLIAVGAAFAGIISAANWLRKNIHSPADMVKLRVKFEKEILPAILAGVGTASAAIGKIFGILSQKLKAVTAALGKLGALVADGMLQFIRDAMDWMVGRFAEITDWATAHLQNLANWLQPIFENVSRFAQLLINFLVKVSQVAANIMDLPSLIIGGLWKRIPLCVRDGIQHFLVSKILKNIPYFDDVVSLVKYWQKIKAGTMDLIRNIFVTGDLKGSMLKAFKLLLDVLGIPVELVTGIYNKAINAFDQVVNKPRIIFGNIVLAIKSGFTQFYSNFFKNALDALGNWLFGMVKGVKLPKEFTIQSLFGLALDILGITESNIFLRIEKKTSRAFAEKLRKGYQGLITSVQWVVQLIKDPKTAYEQAKGKLGQLKDRIFKGIGNWIAKSVIGRFIAEITAKLATSPFGTAVEAIVDAYKMIKTAVEYAERILRIVDSTLDNILELAAGVIGKAAATVEKGLSTGLEIAVAFIAKVLSIGDMPQKIKQIVEEDVRPMVDGVIDGLIDSVITVVSRIKEFGGNIKETIATAFDWGKTRIPFSGENGEAHHLYVENKAGKLVIIVASEPKNIRDLIVEYRLKYMKDEKKMVLVNRTIATLIDAEVAAEEVDQVESHILKASEAQKQVLLKVRDRKFRELLKLETGLTMLLSKMLSGDDYTTLKNIYAIEGRLGIHSFSPKSGLAKFEADHQPNKALLLRTVELFDVSARMKWAASSKAGRAFTIVLGLPRHQEGRTHGNKAKSLTDPFITDLEKKLLAEPDTRERQRIIEKALKLEVIKDAEAMEAVVKVDNLNADQWEDIRSLNLTDDEKKALRNQIQDQVVQGEALIKESNVT